MVYPVTRLLFFSIFGEYPLYMKTKLFHLALTLVFIGQVRSQVTQLSEVFTAPFNAAANGWYIQNNSNPLGSMTWAQGASSVFTSYSGGATDYFMCNFNSQGNGFGTISNFLVTPTLSLMNGGVLKFYTRTVTNPATYPDRLEVRMSIGTGTGNIANSITAVGTFTTQLLSINPNLTNSGYPGVWTAYTMTLSGITGTVTGRFAFRYHVSDGGPSGANSNYIGIDNVEYTTGGPCPPAPVSISPSSATLCQGMGGITLAGSGASTYTWTHNNSHNASVYVTPFGTTIYTLSGSSSSTCPGFATATVYVVTPPNIIAPSVTSCPGSTVMLTASGANTYTWFSGGSGFPISTGSSVVVSVSGPTYYAVYGETAPGCSDYETVSIWTNTFMTVSESSPIACPNQTYILGASGAQSYTWNTGANSPSIVITPTANGTYFVTGSDGNCNETRYINVTIDPNLFAPSFTTCAGTPATLFVSGANSYSWSTGSSSSLIVVSPTANTVYTVTGFSGACSQIKTVSVTIGNNLSVNCSQVCLGTSVLLSAYGANSYTWLPINDNNASVIFTPTAATTFTLLGKSGTCSGSRTIAVTYCASVDEGLTPEELELLVYPNPFKEEFSIQGKAGNIRIFNLFGQLVHEEELEDELHINSSEFSSGLYFIIYTRPMHPGKKVLKVIKN